MLVKNLSKESLERGAKMIIDKNTNVYVRIDTDEELKSFCDFINRYYPNKFHWGGEEPRRTINNKYIYKYCSLRGTLYIGKNYRFYQSTEYYKAGTIHEALGKNAEVVSVYDIIEGNNDIPTMPQWLKGMM